MTKRSVAGWISCPGESVDVVGLHQRNAGSAVLALDNSGVHSGGKCLEQRRFAVVGWRNASGLNLALLRVFPIIIGGDGCALAVVQFEHRIHEWVLNSKRAQRGADR